MKYARWDFEATDSGLTVCKHNHDKGQPCEYEDLTPHETLEILNDMRSKLLRVSFLLQQIELAKLEL